MANSLKGSNRRQYQWRPFFNFVQLKIRSGKQIDVEENKPEKMKKQPSADSPGLGSEEAEKLLERLVRVKGAD